MKNDFSMELNQSLIKGFIDHQHLSKQEYLPQLLINDKKMGKSVFTTIDSKLRSCTEFWFSVAFLTMGGVAIFVDLLKELEENNICGKVLVSQYQNFTQPEALKRLLKFGNIELRIAVKGDFHAKGYLFKTDDSYDLIIGSSNLTDKALYVNKEWNLKVSSTNCGKLIRDTLTEFQNEFSCAEIVNEVFIFEYEKIYKAQKTFLGKSEGVGEIFQYKGITPNSMQAEALKQLEILRRKDKNKALLISATGTGKTYLSAFDVKAMGAEKFLFIVHRENIAKTAQKSYKKVFGKNKTMGLYTGNKKELEADFIFSTVQTLSLDVNLHQFDSKYFDYIVIDETHRVGGETYQKILKHFKPKFLLGMTATPERMDGFDIFKEFDYNIAYEIRLHKALEEQMLCTFHYFGITDITLDGKVLEANADFKLLVADKRVDHIIEKTNFYGCDNGCVRGLIFCSSVRESDELSIIFNSRGYKTVSLSGKSSETERMHAIECLECDDERKLDYIFTVDIFNEGIDIPKVNQIIMLRPTQSAIVFVQQLGRGLRKTADKEYVTIIDFIGNYSNSYLLAIALYGNTSYNKDTLRKLIISGSALIPGASTVHFDEITKERIFESIDKDNMQMKKDLVNDYKLLKYKLGKIPMMMDFLEHGSREPQLYVKYAKSYFNFVVGQEFTLVNSLSADEVELLELFSKEIANGKRIEEIVILREIIAFSFASKEKIQQLIFEKYAVRVNDETLQSCIKNINFEFVAKEKYASNIISYENDIFVFESSLIVALKNEVFKKYFIDLLQYAETVYDQTFDVNEYVDGFILYKKYSRKDAFRILNWHKNPIAQNVGGYMVSSNKTNCPIFITYKKDDNISATTKYVDRFINNYEFEWMSKSKRTLKSPDVLAICNYRTGLRLPLFIKKSSGESNDFYYMGDVTPIENSIEQTSMLDDKGKAVPVVKMRFLLNYPAEDSIYEYLTTAKA